MALPLILTDADHKLIQEFLNKARQRVVNTQNREGVNIEDDIQTPDVYVALTPLNGIPAMSGGYPGYETCEVFQLLPTQFAPTPGSGTGSESPAADRPYQLNDAGFQILEVFNLSDVDIAGESYIVVEKDKWGRWLARDVNPASPPSLSLTVSGAALLTPYSVTTNTPANLSFDPNVFAMIVSGGIDSITSRYAGDGPAGIGILSATTQTIQGLKIFANGITVYEPYIGLLETSGLYAGRGAVIAQVAPDFYIGVGGSNPLLSPQFSLTLAANGISFLAGGETYFAAITAPGPNQTAIQLDSFLGINGSFTSLEGLTIKHYGGIIYFNGTTTTTTTSTTTSTTTTTTTTTTSTTTTTTTTTTSTTTTTTSTTTTTTTTSPPGPMHTSIGEWDSGGSLVSSLQSSPTGIAPNAMMVVKVTVVGNSGTPTVTWNSTTFSLAGSWASLAGGAPVIGGCGVFYSYFAGLTAAQKITITLPSGTGYVTIQAEYITNLASGSLDSQNQTNGLAATASLAWATAHTNAMSEAVFLLITPGGSWTVASPFTSSGQDATMTDGITSVGAEDCFYLATTAATVTAQLNGITPVAYAAAGASFY